MSLVEKVTNGILIIGVQSLAASKSGREDTFYTQVLFYVCGGACLVGASAMLSLAPVEIGRRYWKPKAMTMSDRAEKVEIPAIHINSQNVTEDFWNTVLWIFILLIYIISNILYCRRKDHICVSVTSYWCTLYRVWSGSVHFGPFQPNFEQIGGLNGWTIKHGTNTRAPLYHVWGCANLKSSCTLELDIWCRNLLLLIMEGWVGALPRSRDTSHTWPRWRRIWRASLGASETSKPRWPRRTRRRFKVRNRTELFCCFPFSLHYTISPKQCLIHGI